MTPTGAVAVLIDPADQPCEPHHAATPCSHRDGEGMTGSPYGLPTTGTPALTSATIR
jgi:hypothetical protein